jgi:putative transposase
MPKKRCKPGEASLEMSWQDVERCFERFCLTAGIRAIEQMLGEEVEQLNAAPHSRGGTCRGHRWGRTQGKIVFHGGKVAVHRFRLQCRLTPAATLFR